MHIVSPAVLQQLSKDARRAAMFRSRMEAVDKWMSDRGLDKKIRYSISKFYAEVWHAAGLPAMPFSDA